MFRAGESRDRALDLSAHVDRAQFQSERRRCGADGAELANPGRIGGIPKYRRSGQPRCDLPEQLQPFAAETVLELHEAGGVAARAGQTVDQAGTDRIGDAHEHDRQGARSPLQRRHALGATGQHDIRGERDQFRRVLALVFDIVLAPARVDPRVATLAPAQLLQDLLERRDTYLTLWIVSRHVHEHANAPPALRLLRTHRERPHRHAAEQRDELAPSHSITSSAVSRSDGATVMPSAPAVFKLIDSSNLVGLWTGRSPGLAPLSMRST